MSFRDGRSEVRIEDEPLVRGQGRYTGDRRFDGEAAMVVVRSPFASGRISTLDVAEAREAAGVLAVMTAADLPPETGTFSPRMVHARPDGQPMYVPPFPPLTGDAVRYVGDPVAAIFAETKEEAEAAAELVVFDVEEGDPVVDPLAAVEPDAPLVWPDSAGNLAFRVERGDRAAVEAAFADAPHVVRQRLAVTRVIAAPIETRNAVGFYDGDEARYTLRVGTQAAHRLRDGLCEVLGVDPEGLRVVSEDTGGSFGMKNTPFPEYALLLFGARALGRPVRWRATRLESFMSDAHAREQVIDAALAFDGEGRFLALDLHAVANIGAYLGQMSTLPMVNNIGGAAGVYRTPAIAATIDGVFTNTQNMSPYRGAGRPEATYAMERMADLAARELGLDAAEIRRRNLVAPDQMPYRTPLTFTYDSGDFPAVLQEALTAADWDGFPARRDESRERGLLRGIGISLPIEIAGGPDENPMPEFASIALDPDGRFVVALGSGDTGQGHATTFAPIIADTLGVEPEAIRFVTGDTGVVAKGIGTFGSRTSAVAGTAAVRAGEALVEKAKQKSAELLEVAAADVEFSDGAFRIVGTDRAVTYADLASAGVELSTEEYSATDGATFPNGCHVCEVEIDPETGATSVVRYTVVDDVGNVLNHALLKGQIHGGVAQGAGQALMEYMLYEPDSGQLVTASFQDYAIPRAEEMPSFEVRSHPVPTRKNPLGVKGAGEAGTVGSLPVVINAICDALAPLGVRHVDMPATPERVWRAIQDAKAG